MFIMQVLAEQCPRTGIALGTRLASQLPFWANRNTELAVPLFWPVNCAKIGGNVALLSGATVYSLYCAACVGFCKLSVS